MPTSVVRSACKEVMALTRLNNAHIVQLLGVQVCRRTDGAQRVDAEAARESGGRSAAAVGGGVAAAATAAAGGDGGQQPPSHPPVPSR